MPPRNILVFLCSETASGAILGKHLFRRYNTDLVLWLTYCMKRYFLHLGCKHVQKVCVWGEGGGGSCPPLPLPFPTLVIHP